MFLVKESITIPYQVTIEMLPEIAELLSTERVQYFVPLRTHLSRCGETDFCK